MPAISKKTQTPPEEQEGYIYESCGNVFADLGVPDPEIHLEKAKLTMKLHQAITERKLTIPKAAKLLGVTTDSLNMILRGSFSEYSLDQLLRFLAVFGQTFEITLRPMSSKPFTARSGTKTPSRAAWA